MKKTLPIGPMPQIRTTDDAIRLAVENGYDPKGQLPSNVWEYLNDLSPFGYWPGWNYAGEFGVWPDGDLTD